MVPFLGFLSIIPLEIAGFGTLRKSFHLFRWSCTLLPDEGFAFGVNIHAKSNGVCIEVVDTVEMIQEGVSYEE